MKIATWNVNSVKARIPRVLEFLHTHRPDVLCLQETKTMPEGFPRGARIATQGTPITDVTCGLPGAPLPEEARWGARR